MRKIAVIISCHCSCVNKCMVPRINAFLVTHQDVTMDLFYVLGESNFQTPLFDTDRANVVIVSTGVYVTSPTYLAKDANAAETMAQFYFNKYACNFTSTGTYDCVIRFKHDVDVDFPEAIATGTLAGNTLYVPDCNHGNGVNSDIAWGTVDSMCKYGCVYDHIIANNGNFPCAFNQNELLEYIGTNLEGLTFVRDSTFTYGA